MALPAPDPAPPPQMATARLDALLTAADAARRLGVPRATVHRWLWSGALPGYRAGGLQAGWRVRESDLDVFMASPWDSIDSSRQEA
jgi:excisionase family DNA binding protein